MGDPQALAPSFTGAFLSAYPMMSMLPPTPRPQPTKLLPGDVRGLRDMLGAMLQAGRLTYAQHQNVASMHARLSDAEQALPPSIPEAMATFLRAFKARDVEPLREAGKSVLDAVILSGDQPGSVVLQEAMHEFTLAMVSYLEGKAPAGAATDAGASTAASADSNKVLFWTEPDPDLFYALDSTSGVAITDLIDDLHHIDRYVERGAEAPNRVLLDGPPGSGKSHGAKYIAAKLGKRLATIKLSTVISKYIGESGERFATAVAAAVAAGAVLFVDELDTLGGHREQAEGGAADHTAKVVGVINETLDNAPEGFIIIGATNLPTAVDPSVARRFRERIAFGNPDRATREVMVRHYWQRAPFDSDAFDSIVARTEGRSGDLVKRAAHNANRRAAKRDRDAAITQHDVMLALASMPKEAAIGEGRKASGLVLAR